MQELRLILIVVGLLSVVALLFHRRWAISFKKKGRSTFNRKPLTKTVDPVNSYKNKKESNFSSGRRATDPLINSPSFCDLEHPSITWSEAGTQIRDKGFEAVVLNVHCTGDRLFSGRDIFDSMNRNGLLYGDMDIFHFYGSSNGAGKACFSVANIMYPGTLHQENANFATKGLALFMMLPCSGCPDKNFRMMLKMAHIIASDLGGSVLDENRDPITQEGINQYSRRIQQFEAKVKEKSQ